MLDNKTMKVQKTKVSKIVTQIPCTATSLHYVHILYLSVNIYYYPVFEWYNVECRMCELIQESLRFITSNRWHTV